MFFVQSQSLTRFFVQSKKFFALPTATKMLAPHPPGGSHHRGYSSLGVEKVSQNVFDEEEIRKLRAVSWLSLSKMNRGAHMIKIPDYKESFESGNVHDEMQPNIWLPEEALPGFREFMEGFFDVSGFEYLILSLVLYFIIIMDKIPISESEIEKQHYQLTHPRLWHP